MKAEVELILEQILSFWSQKYFTPGPEDRLSESLPWNYHWKVRDDCFEVFYSQPSKKCPVPRAYAKVWFTIDKADAVPLLLI